MTAKFSYTMDLAGVVEILKSAPVKAALAEEAEKKCAEANRLLAAHGESDGEHVYMHHGHDLTHTSIESVHTSGKTTEIDQAKHRTLDAINH